MITCLKSRPSWTTICLLCMTFCGTAEENPFAEGPGEKLQKDNPFASREGAVQYAVSSNSKGEKKTKRRTISKDLTSEEIISIGADENLIIDPGVTIRFGAGGGIDCRGTLTAIGTKEKPIRLTALDPERGWLNVSLVENAASNSRLEWCVISHGRGRKFELDEHRRFKRFLDPSAPPSRLGICGGGLFVFRCQNVEIRRCRFEKNSATSGAGIAWIGTQTGTISHCVFTENKATHAGGAIITLGSSSPHIACNYIKNNQAENLGGALMIASNCSPFIVNNWICFNKAPSGSGLAAQHRVTCNIQGNFFSENENENGRGIIMLGNNSILNLRGNFIDTGGEAGKDPNPFFIHSKGKEGEDHSKHDLLDSADKGTVLKALEAEGVMALAELMK